MCPLWKRVVVKGDSMVPTIREGQRILVSLFHYRLRQPRRGDIVVLHHPKRPFKLLKRIVGTPGDDVETGVRLGDDEYFVKGDNPECNSDSRTFGPVRRDLIVGKAWLSYAPPRRIV